MDGFNMGHEKTLSGLDEVNCDTLYSSTYNGVDKQNIIYINGLQSNCQNQINNLQNQISNITSTSTPGGGYFNIWYETYGGFNTSLYQWSMGANGQTPSAMNMPIMTTCKLTNAYVICQSTPASTARVDIFVNSSAVYSMLNITNAGLTSFTPNLNINSGDLLNLKTITGSGGGIIRVYLCFTCVGVKGADGVTPAFVIGNVETLSPGSDAYATITGTTAVPVLNLGIPKGAKGSKGDSGDGGAVAESALVLATTAEANVLALDVVVSGQAGAIAGLTTNVGSLNTSVSTVMNRTTGMSYSFSGTNFSKGDVWISDGGNGGLSSAVTLSATTDNEFLRLIRCPTIICNSGTSSFVDIATDSLSSNGDIVSNTTVTGNNIVATNNISITNGVLDISRSAINKKLILYDQTSNNNNNFVGISTSTPSFGVNMDYHVGNDLGSHRFLYASVSGLSSIPILDLNSTTTNLTTNSINLRASGNTSTYRDCGIDISNVSTLASDLGLMTIKGGILELNSSKTNLTSSNINLRASGNASIFRDCGIDVTSSSTSISDLGQMSLRGGIINIGNASGASVINLNGIVNYSGANFNILGSFFSQW